MEEKLKNNTSSLYEITETIAGLDSLLNYLRSVSDSATLNANAMVSQCTANAISDIEKLKKEVEYLREMKVVERRGGSIGVCCLDTNHMTVTR